MTVTIRPRPLQAGDEVRVVAPLTSLSIIAPELREIALRRLEEFGLTITCGKNVLMSQLILAR